MTTFPLDIVRYYDEDGECVSEEIYDYYGKELFFVCNLSEYPEDAIIGRNLFTANDFVKAVRYGMELAKRGHADVNITEIVQHKGEEQ